MKLINKLITQPVSFYSFVQMYGGWGEGGGAKHGAEGGARISGQKRRNMDGGPFRQMQDNEQTDGRAGIIDIPYRRGTTD